jgi:hypothetical protein
MSGFRAIHGEALAFSFLISALKKIGEVRTGPTPQVAETRSSGAASVAGAPQAGPALQTWAKK